MIGDPATRYREDPVRILRAIRIAAKTRFYDRRENRRSDALHADAAAFRSERPSGG